jgi:hypothetical protein
LRIANWASQGLPYCITLSCAHSLVPSNEKNIFAQNFVCKWKFLSKQRKKGRTATHDPDFSSHFNFSGAAIKQFNCHPCFLHVCIYILACMHEQKTTGCPTSMPFRVTRWVCGKITQNLAKYLVKINAYILPGLNK